METNRWCDAVNCLFCGNVHACVMGCETVTESSRAFVGDTIDAICVVSHSAAKSPHSVTSLIGTMS